MLARALDPVQQGFYIDIGAWHPDRDSVTRHFYDQGWSGVNVDPGRLYIERLRERRPRDTNLNLAISDRPGTVQFHEALHSGLSGLDAAVLQQARKHRIETRSFEVQAITLADLCEKHAAGREIHFMKIDVEGHEPAVIASGDWRRFRPWIVVVEAITPERKPAWPGFEPILLEHGYLFAWDDGLNRFYVRRESDSLLSQFRNPPNVFDTVVRFPDDPLGRVLGRIYAAYIFLQRTYRRMR